MYLKDHYKTLELTPSATMAEIKTAYRRLAQVHHPDKNNGDPYAVTYFQAIKEAYDVLSNPVKKEKYLQQRWYHQSTGSKRTQEIQTPFTILKQVLELDKYVHTLDVHRMDREGLQNYILEVISGEAIEKLNLFNDLVVNREISNTILRCITPLPYKYVIPVYEQLRKINNDAITSDLLREHQQLRRQVHRWERYKVWLILLAVILVCWLIFYFS